VTRAIASPTIVERRCPTCISLAMFGEEYSTMTALGRDFSGVPSLGSASRPAAASAIHRARSVKVADDLARDVAGCLAEPLPEPE
jgi:hypothetical protein